jgi:hypothetical protein
MKASKSGFRTIAFRKAAIRFHPDCGVAEIVTLPSGMPSWLWRLSVCTRLRRLGVQITDEPLNYPELDLWTAS